MKKIISILLMVLFVIGSTKVQAANDSFGTTLEINHAQAKKGDNITVTIGLKDIDIKSGEKGIGAYTAGIQFDSSVLEYVSTDGTDKWEAPFYQDGFITSNTKDAEVVTSTQSIGTITFKVKENAKLGETSISVVNFSGSTAGPDVLASNNVTTKLTIINNSSDKTDLEDNKVQESSSTVYGENVLPKTGKEQNPFLMMLYALIGLSIIGVVGLVYLLKNRDN